MTFSAESDKYLNFESIKTVESFIPSYVIEVSYFENKIINIWIWICNDKNIKTTFRAYLRGCYSKTNWNYGEEIAVKSVIKFRVYQDWLLEEFS